MFTGIITHTGKLQKKHGASATFHASAAVCRRLRAGGSIAVNGACLTVVRARRASFDVDIMPETEAKTTLGLLERGQVVNLELPVTPNTFLSGHIVQGHIDGIGLVKSMGQEGNSRILEIRIPQTLSRYVVPKGSITINGVSLTVISVRAHSFTVGIIPHTWESTAMCTLKIDDSINLEVDILAKYVEQLLTKH